MTRLLFCATWNNLMGMKSVYMVAYSIGHETENNAISTQVYCGQVSGLYTQYQSTIFTAGKTFELRYFIKGYTLSYSITM